MDLCLLPFARNGNTIVQHIAISAGFLQIITCGMLYGWPSVALPELLHPKSYHLGFAVSGNEGSCLALLPLIGALCVSPFAHHLMKLFGRKTILQLTAIPSIISWFLVASSSNVYYLLIARFIGGLSDGIFFIVAPMYLSEIVNPSKRGLLASFMTIFMLVGILLINLVGFYVSVYYSAIIAITLLTLSFVLFIFIPESPHALIHKRRPKKAKICLRIFRGESNVDDEYQKIEQSVHLRMVETRGQLKDLFIGVNKKPMWVLMLINASQQLSGITAISFYITIIFQRSGLTFAASYGTICFFFVQLLATASSFYLVDKKDRKFLLLLSCGGCFTTLLLGGVYFQFCIGLISNFWFGMIPLFILIVYIVFYSLGLQNIPTLMMGEMFHSKRDLVFSFTEIYYDALASLVTKTFQLIDDLYGVHIVFYLFSMLTFLCTILIKLSVPKTTRVNSEETQSLLQKEECIKTNEQVFFGEGNNDFEEKYYGDNPYIF